MARAREVLTAALESSMRAHGIVGEDADFEFHTNAGTTLIGCSWPIKNDPERPNKRSTPLRIVLTRRLSDLLLAEDDEQYSKHVRGVLEIMGNRIREYSPDPQVARGEYVDPFDIHIDIVDLP